MSVYLICQKDQDSVPRGASLRLVERTGTNGAVQVEEKRFVADGDYTGHWETAHTMTPAAAQARVRTFLGLGK